MVLTDKKVELPDIYFDDTDLDHLYEIPVIFDYTNLPWKQQRKAKQEIEFFKTLYRGVMLVTGPPRSGKDLFGTSFSYKNKLYFGRPILLDFKPKRLFGEYVPFSPVMMLREINKMAKASDLSRLTDEEEPMTEKQESLFKDASKDWLEENETKFKNCILYLSELKRYCYNRNPHSRMNKFIGQLCTIHGHLDMLILGTHVQKHEIDQYSFLPYVTFWAKCKWSVSRLNNTRVDITRGSFVTDNGTFDVSREPTRYWVDGGAPRDFLDGARLFDLYNTQNLVNLKPVASKEISE